MTKYRIETTLKHDGKQFEVGSTIELEEKHAIPLLASEVVSLADKKATETESEGKKGKK